MKILICSHRFHLDIGGIETVSEILAQHFAAGGHTVHLITQSPRDFISDQKSPFNHIATALGAATAALQKAPRDCPPHLDSYGEW